MNFSISYITDFVHNGVFGNSFDIRYEEVWLYCLTTGREGKKLYLNQIHICEKQYTSLPMYFPVRTNT